MASVCVWSISHVVPGGAKTLIALNHFRLCILHFLWHQFLIWAHPLGAGRIEWWVFSEAQSAIYPLISPNLGKLGTDPSARDGMRDGPPKALAI